MRDRAAKPLAGRAGPRCHDLAKERALHLLYLAPTLAHHTSDGLTIRSCTFATTSCAARRSINGYISSLAEYRCRKSDLNSNHCILAATCTSAWASLPSAAAEECIHDVAEIKTLGTPPATAAERITT
jgi:hypothetical protein